MFTNRTIFVTTLGIKDQSSNAKVPNDGYWHHIAVVHENKKEFLITSMVSWRTPRPTPGVSTSPEPTKWFYIGSQPTFGLQYAGWLDRLKVNKGVLTPEQLDFQRRHCTNRYNGRHPWRRSWRGV